jgi:hypothetical protein
VPVRTAATTADLAVGEIVKLSAVMNKYVQAVVRRRRGAMYGFEYSEVPPNIREAILKLCEGLPLFQSLIDS